MYNTEILNKQNCEKEKRMEESICILLTLLRDVKYDSNPWRIKTFCDKNVILNICFTLYTPFNKFFDIFPEKMFFLTLNVKA